MVDYVNTHYRENNVTLRTVADIFSYTEKYLSHFFKNKMGVGFNEYLGELRLKYAYKLMADGVHSVSEIALKCGFSDPLYFSKFFKKKTGLAPTEYMLTLNG
jgi:YesN/AraC family two-component response regulator